MPLCSYSLRSGSDRQEGTDWRRRRWLKQVRQRSLGWRATRDSCRPGGVAVSILRTISTAPFTRVQCQNVQQETICAFVWVCWYQTFSARESGWSCICSLRCSARGSSGTYSKAREYRIESRHCLLILTIYQDPRHDENCSGGLWPHRLGRGLWPP